MKKITLLSSLLTISLIPTITFAARKDLQYLVDLVMYYFTTAIYLILALAVLMFVWNVFKYFIKGGDDVTAKKEAGLYVMWSVIGFFVILSFWGLVNIVIKTFDLDSEAPSSFFGTFRSSSNNPFTGESDFTDTFQGSGSLPGNIETTGGTGEGAPLRGSGIPEAWDH